MKPEAPTLKIWAWAAVLFILFQTGLAILSQNEELKFLLDKEALPALSEKVKSVCDSLRKAPEEAKKVIVIGSSLTEEGIEPDFIKKYSAGREQTVFLEKLTMGGHRLNLMIRGSGIFDSLNILKPDLVLIQNDLLTTSFDGLAEDLRYEFPGFFESVFRVNKRFLVRCILHFRRKNNFVPFAVTPHTTDTLEFRPGNRTVLNFTAADYAHPSLNKLNQQKIKTVLLDLPRPEKAEELIYSDSYKKEYFELLKLYEQTFNTDFWKYDGPVLYFKHFLDGAHLDAEGRKIYSEWLTDKILTEINDL